MCAPARGERIATLFKAVFSRFLAMLSMRRDFLGKVLQRNAPCRLLNRPRLWNESPLFRKKTPTFFEKSPSFSRKSPTFLRKSPTIFSVLSYVLNYTSSEGGESNHEFLGLQIRCVEARKHFMIDIFSISSSSAQQYCVGSQKNPTHRRMNGILLSFSAVLTTRIKDAIKRCLRANRKE